MCTSSHPLQHHTARQHVNGFIISIMRWYFFFFLFFRPPRSSPYSAVYIGLFFSPVIIPSPTALQTSAGYSYCSVIQVSGGFAFYIVSLLFCCVTVCGDGSRSDRTVRMSTALSVLLQYCATSAALRRERPEIVPSHLYLGLWFAVRPKIASILTVSEILS